MSNVRTLSSSPSSDDTVGTVSNGSAGNTDRLHVSVERQWTRQAYYGYVITLARSASVICVDCHRNASKYLSS